MFLLRKLFQAKAAWEKVWSFKWAEEAKGSKFKPKPPAYSLAPCAMGMPGWAEATRGVLVHVWDRAGHWVAPEPGLMQPLGNSPCGRHLPDMDSDIQGSWRAACSAWVLWVSEMGMVAAVVGSLVWAR